MIIDDKSNGASYQVLQNYNTPPASVNSNKRSNEEMGNIDETSEPPQKMTHAELLFVRMQDIQNTVVENLTARAEDMRLQHIHKLGEAKIGDTVQVDVSGVDRGPGDLPMISCYILKINNETSMYKIATKHGVIEGWLARNQFQLCKQKLFTIDQVNIEKEFS